MTIQDVKNQALIDAICDQRNALANEAAMLRAECAALKAALAAQSSAAQDRDLTEEDVRVAADATRLGNVRSARGG